MDVKRFQFLISQKILPATIFLRECDDRSKESRLNEGHVEIAKDQFRIHVLVEVVELALTHFLRYLLHVDH